MTNDEWSEAFRAGFKSGYEKAMQDNPSSVPTEIKLVWPDYDFKIESYAKPTIHISMKRSDQ